MISVECFWFRTQSLEVMKSSHSKVLQEMEILNAQLKEVRGLDIRFNVTGTFSKLINPRNP